MVPLCISHLIEEEPYSPTSSRISSVPRDHRIHHPKVLDCLAALDALEERQSPRRNSLSGVPTATLYKLSVIGANPSNVVDHASSTASCGSDPNSLGRKTLSSKRPTRRSSSCSAPVRKPMHPTKVQRWAGLTRTVDDWNLLRRDPELWYEDGDCFVHLHSRGGSRRGPSFCIPFRILRQKKCSAMLSLCDAQMTSATSPSSHELKRMPSTLMDVNQNSSMIQLFIPVPEETSREASFRWHITTRNLFAFLLGKPLVGEHMGQAFVHLQERLALYRPTHASNHQDFLDYAEHQGYRDLVECTDYALASLFYAEHYKLRDVWIDAFAHCVGMHDSLALSPEYALNSRLTKALIARAHVEVELHLGRVSNALGGFLTEDLSPAYLGLTDGARSHLDKFRRFLHTFYVGKFGYWPPPQGASFPKALYKSMYYDFQHLYNYLVDLESTFNFASQKPASGGICVLQNIDNFDKRHNFKSQPHPLPLLPTYAHPIKKLDSQKALRQLTLASQHNKTHNLPSISAALSVATNTLDLDVTSSKIVQAYSNFERSNAINASQREEKISFVDARKVSWLLIYGTLQYLTAALRGPKEVRDFESPDYPLCCMAEQSTWGSRSQEATLVSSPSVSAPLAMTDPLSGQQRNSAYSIEPDCHREDYFSSKSSSRRGSVEVAVPVKPAVPLRQSSLRSFGPRSISVRSSRSSHRNSLTLKPTQHCAILVQGYGDGLIEPSWNRLQQEKPRPASSIYSERSSVSILPDGSRPYSSWLRSRTPSAPPSASHSRNTSADLYHNRTSTLDSFQNQEFLGVMTPGLMTEPPTRSDSTGSTASSLWSEGASVASSKTSTDGESYNPHKTSTAESSGLLGGLVPVGNFVTGMSRTPSSSPGIIPQSHIHPLLRKPSPPNDFDFKFEARHIGHTRTDVYSSESDSTIGVAFSGPPSPPISDMPITITRSDAAALASEKRPRGPRRSFSAEPAAASPSAFSEKRMSHVFHDLNSSSSAMWEHYRASLGRHQSPCSSGSAGEASSQSTSKAANSVKVRSLRFASKTSVEVDASKKKDRRLSSLLWRR